MKQNHASSAGVAWLVVAFLAAAACQPEAYTERVRYGSAIAVAYYRCGYLEKIESDRDGDGTMDGLSLVMGPGSIREPGSWSAKEEFLDTNEDGTWDVAGMQRNYGAIRGAMCWMDTDYDGVYDVRYYGDEAIRRCWSEALSKIPWTPPSR